MADRGYRGRPQRGERADRQINAGHSRGLVWLCPTQKLRLES